MSQDRLSSSETSGTNFASLKGHAKSLTLVSNVEDDLTSATTSAATNNKAVTFSSNSYLCVPTIFSNITVVAKNQNIYAQGNAFATTVGSSITNGPNIYGGTNGTSNITSNGTSIYLGAYGEGSWSIYGGNDGSSTGKDSTISSNTHVSISGLNGNIVAVLSAGNSAGGAILGDTNI